MIGRKLGRQEQINNKNIYVPNRRVYKIHLLKLK